MGNFVPWLCLKLRLNKAIALWLPHPTYLVIFPGRNKDATRRNRIPRIHRVLVTESAVILWKISAYAERISSSEAKKNFKQEGECQYFQGLAPLAFSRNLRALGAVHPMISTHWCRSQCCQRRNKEVRVVGFDFDSRQSPRTQGLHM